MSDIVVPPAEGGGFQVGTLMTSQEAVVHGLIGAQYGDLEFDVGKSVRWTQWFTDDIFITDVNLGTPRYWIVNWTETFAEANHTVTGVNWFVVPTEFRKQQFADAMKHPAILLEPEDWVIFVDAHEGLAIDTRNPQPNDYLIEPFRSYLYREISRANAAARDRLVLPFYVFLRHDNIVVVDYPSPAFAGGELGVTTAQGSLGTPYYLAHQGLTRMMKVKVLQNPGFNWATIDQPTTATPGMNISLVSYGYAHWNMQDIVPPATTVEPLSEANDDGWRMRKLVSMVRPVPTIPYTDPYKTPAQDPVGLAGPWAPADQNTPDPISNSGPYLIPAVGTVNTPDPGVLPNSFVVVQKTRYADTTNFPTLVAQTGGTDPRSYFIYRTPVNYRWYIEFTTDGVWANRLSKFADGDVPVIGFDQTSALAIAQNSAGRFLMTPWLRNPVTGQWTSYSTLDTGAAVTIFDVTTLLQVGGLFSAGSRLYSAEMRTGLDPAAGTVLWRFDASEYPGTGLSYTDPRGRTWTLTNANAIVANTVDSMQQPVPPNSSLLGLQVGLYDSVLRLNMRDGVYYEGDELGNIPLKWDPVKNTWVPSSITTEEWHGTEDWVASPT